MWEIINRSGLLVSTIAALAVYPRAYAVTRICSWLGLLSCFLAVASAPLRPDLHWRSLLLWLCNAFLAAVSALDLSGASPVHILSVVGSVSLVVCFFTALLYLLLPVPSACTLTGPHNIGTLTFNLSDAEGKEGEGYEALVVQCWFPVSPPSPRPSPGMGLGPWLEWVPYSWSLCPPRALMWTSGHPQHQVEESLALLKQLAKKRMPAWVVRHIGMHGVTINITIIQLQLYCYTIILLYYYTNY
jgi:hypothetical protein